MATGSRFREARRITWRHRAFRASIAGSIIGALLFGVLVHGIFESPLRKDSIKPDDETVAVPTDNENSTTTTSPPVTSTTADTAETTSTTAPAVDVVVAPAAVPYVFGDTIMVAGSAETARTATGLRDNGGKHGVAVRVEGDTPLLADVAARIAGVPVASSNTVIVDIPTPPGTAEELAALLDDVVAAAGPERVLLFVTTFSPDNSHATYNQAINRLASFNSNVEVLPWHREAGLSYQMLYNGDGTLRNPDGVVYRNGWLTAQILGH